MSVDERDLERMAARLGVAAAERLDVDATAEAVLRRLRAERPLPLRLIRRWRPIVAIAATLTVAALGGGLIYRASTGAEPGPMVTVQPPTVPSIEALSAPQLDQVLDSLDIEAPAHEHLAASIEDLDASQLKDLLQRMEG
ncbi:MAG TPA: hypothetical protein VJ992_11280 [Gemmatimonadales bacterium]|nr:hypothetical protein [Gemmatimonadales bacterium]